MKAKRHRNVCGPQLRRLRYEREWSQEMLATKCQVAGFDISRDVIASIELRRRCIEDDELAQFALVLGVAITELFPARLRAKLSKLITAAAAAAARG